MQNKIKQSNPGKWFTFYKVDKYNDHNIIGMKGVWSDFSEGSFFFINHFCSFLSSNGTINTQIVEIVYNLQRCHVLTFK